MAGPREGTRRRHTRSEGCGSRSSAEAWTGHLKTVGGRARDAMKKITAGHAVELTSARRHRGGHPAEGGRVKESSEASTSVSQPLGRRQTSSRAHRGDPGRQASRLQPNNVGEAGRSGEAADHDGEGARGGTRRSGRGPAQKIGGSRQG